MQRRESDGAADILVGVVFWCLSIGSTQSAAFDFNIPNLSPTLSARLVVAECNSETCSGPATVELLDRKTQKTIQKLETEDLAIMLGRNGKPTINETLLYSDQSALISDDFNFDGLQDLAIRNGNNSSYGGPSYDVYVYNKTKRRLVPSEELTALALEHLGMFEVDHQRQRLTMLSKSGCCFHVTTEYAVVPKIGLKRVYELTEDAQGGGDDVKVTTGKLSGTTWVETIKSYPFDEYYKAQ